jgi:hypothetical protein
MTNDAAPTVLAIWPKNGLMFDERKTNLSSPHHHSFKVEHQSVDLIMAPKVGIDILVHSFGYFIVPGIIFACWYPFRETDEAKHRQLEQQYPESVKTARASRQNMQVFYVAHSL